MLHIFRNITIKHHSCVNVHAIGQFLQQLKNEFNNTNNKWAFQVHAIQSDNFPIKYFTNRLNVPTFETLLQNCVNCSVEGIVIKIRQITYRLIVKIGIFEMFKLFIK